MNARNVSRITAVINRDYDMRPDGILPVLKRCGIESAAIASGRTVTLRKNSGYLHSAFNRPHPLSSNPVDVFSFFTTPEFETAAMYRIIDEFKLFLPGNGSL